MVLSQRGAQLLGFSLRAAASSAIAFARRRSLEVDPLRSHDRLPAGRAPRLFSASVFTRAHLVSSTDSDVDAHHHELALARLDDRCA